MELETLNNTKDNLSETTDKFEIDIIYRNNKFYINEFGMNLESKYLHSVEEDARDYLYEKFRIEKSRICFNLL